MVSCQKLLQKIQSFFKLNKKPAERPSCHKFILITYDKSLECKEEDEYREYEIYTITFVNNHQYKSKDKEYIQLYKGNWDKIYKGMFNHSDGSFFTDALHIPLFDRYHNNCADCGKPAITREEAELLANSATLGSFEGIKNMAIENYYGIRVGHDC